MTDRHLVPTLDHSLAWQRRPAFFRLLNNSVQWMKKSGLYDETIIKDNAMPPLSSPQPRSFVSVPFEKPSANRGDRGRPIGPFDGRTGTDWPCCGGAGAKKTSSRIVSSSSLMADRSVKSNVSQFKCLHLTSLEATDRQGALIQNRSQAV